jgi:hypothetical protein
MPFNGSGTFNRYTPGNPAITGTTISSVTYNATIQDLANGLSNAITRDGQGVPTANLPMANFRVTGMANGVDAQDAATLAQVQSAATQILSSITGTNTITGNLSPVITAYAAGQTFRFIAAGANTGATTININGLGAKAITKTGATPLEPGDIAAGAAVQIVYDGTQFQITSGAGGSSGNTFAQDNLTVPAGTGRSLVGPITLTGIMTISGRLVVL